MKGSTIALLSLFSLSSSFVSAIAVANRDYDQLLWKSLSTSNRYHAPRINLTNIQVRETNNTGCIPTILMHGLGDASTNSGMESLAQSIMTAFPGCYAVCAPVGDGLFSFIIPIQDQVNEFIQVVRNDPILAAADEINVVGLSQGGLIVRGYIEQRASTDPAVKNFVSICGVQNGVYNCPLELQVIPFLCDIFESDPYNFLFNGSFPLSFSDYFVTYWDQNEFLTRNQYLPKINNLLGMNQPNATQYRNNMLAVKQMVLSQATEDTVVYPFQSEQFGGYQWTNGNKTNPVVYTLENSDQWTYDYLGLKTLTLTNRTVFTQFQGDHLKFNDSYWNDVILPYLH